MKRKLLWIVPAAICLVAAVLLALEASERIRIDGPGAELLSLMAPTETEYAEGYSHAGFNKIRIGMSEQEVLDILGEPLTRWAPYRPPRFPDKAQIVGLEYSRSPSSKSYRLRQVNIDKGVVAEIRGYFYVD